MVTKIHERKNLIEFITHEREEKMSERLRFSEFDAHQLNLYMMIDWGCSSMRLCYCLLMIY